MKDRSGEVAPSRTLLRQYHLTLAVSVALVLLVSGLLIFFQFGKQKEIELVHIREMVHNRSQEAEIALSGVVDRIRELHLMTRQVWANPESFPPSPLYDKIGYNPESGLFSLELGPMRQAIHEMGSLHGMIDFPNIGPEKRTEINAALSLIPFLRAAVKTSSSLRYIYSQSTPDLPYAAIYPPILEREMIQLSGTVLGFRDAAYEASFWVQALPENNPRRRPFWSDYYIDISGSGHLFVSHVIPVYLGDTFRGIAAADIDLGFLQPFVTQELYPGGELLIINDLRQVVAHSRREVAATERLQTLEQHLPPRPGHSHLPPLFVRSRNRGGNRGPLSDLGPLEKRPVAPDLLDSRRRPDPPGDERSLLLSVAVGRGVVTLFGGILDF